NLDGLAVPNVPTDAGLRQFYENAITEALTKLNLNTRIKLAKNAKIPNLVLYDAEKWSLNEQPPQPIADLVKTDDPKNHEQTTRVQPVLLSLKADPTKNLLLAAMHFQNADPAAAINSIHEQAVALRTRLNTPPNPPAAAPNPPHTVDYA